MNIEKIELTRIINEQFSIERKRGNKNLINLSILFSGLISLLLIPSVKEEKLPLFLTINIIFILYLIAYKLISIKIEIPWWIKIINVIIITSYPTGIFIEIYYFTKNPMYLIFQSPIFFYYAIIASATALLYSQKLSLFIGTLNSIEYIAFLFITFPKYPEFLFSTTWTGITELLLKISLILFSGYVAGIAARNTSSLINRISNLIMSKRRIDREIELAGSIQRSILPKEIPDIPELNIETYYYPVATIGGDFYDFFPLKRNKLGIFISDVSGHGVPASLVTAMIKMALSSDTWNKPFPRLLFMNLNKYLVGKISDHFITAFYGVFSIKRKEFRFSNAGHPPPLLYKRNKDKIIELKTKGTIIGTFEEIDIEEKNIVLNSGDRILIYTDGITDIFNEKNEMFGDKRLKEIFLKTKDMPLKQVKETIIEEVWNFTSGRLNLEDDITMILIEVK